MRGISGGDGGEVRQQIGRGEGKKISARKKRLEGNRRGKEEKKEGR